MQLASLAAKGFVCALTFTAMLIFPGGVAAETAPAPNLLILRVATTPNDEVTPLLYALQQGLFQKAGLDVRIERQSNGGAVAAALLGGSYEIGKVSVTALFNAHEKRLPLEIIAPAGMFDGRAPFSQLIVAKDSSITSAEDLNGKTIAVDSLNGIGRVAFDTWMKKNGGDVQSVHYVEVPFSVAQTAVEQHRLDAVAGIVEPYLTKALAAGKVRAFRDFDAAIAPSFMFTAWVANSDWAKKHSDVVKAFARVMAQSAAYTNANPTKTAPMVADFTGVPVETIKNMIRAIGGTMLDATELQPSIDAAARDGVIKHVFPASDLLDSDLTGK